VSAVNHITCFLIAGARCVGVVCAANFRVVVHPAITERHKGSALPLFVRLTLPLGWHPTPAGQRPAGASGCFMCS
jgi:hypothetical protein